MLGNLENLKFPQFIVTIKNKITPYRSSTLHFKFKVNIFSRAFPFFYNFLYHIQILAMLPVKRELSLLLKPISLMQNKQLKILRASKCRHCKYLADVVT